MNPGGCPLSVDLYSRDLSEALVRVIESAASVRRRHHFFGWSQGVLQYFLPHQVSICAAYQRQHKALVFDVYNSIPVSPALLAILRDGQSPPLRQIVGEWIGHGGHCTLIDVAGIGRRSGGDLASVLAEANIGELLVHGVARPQRPHELESLFLFAAAAGKQWGDEHRMFFEMLLPVIHRTYLQVQVVEREVGKLEAPAPAAKWRDQDCGITSREREILSWVREGMSNLEIGVQLDISALTVKNHLQKVFRKLGAGNRTQAVALAIEMNLIPDRRETLDRRRPNTER